MKILLSIALLTTALVTFASATEPRAENRKGERLFQQGEFATAADAFQAAAASASSQNLDPAVPLFNAGVARLRAADSEQAASGFLAATRTPDLTLQSLAYFNAGTVRLLQIQQASQAGQASNVLAQLAQSIECLEQSLMIKPGRAETRHNLEVALTYRAAILAALARLVAAMDSAGRQVAQHQFVEAHQTLQQAGNELATALPLHPDQQKQFEQLLERTGQISEILKATETGSSGP